MSKHTDDLISHIEQFLLWHSSNPSTISIAKVGPEGPNQVNLTLGELRNLMDRVVYPLRYLDQEHEHPVGTVQENLELQGQRYAVVRVDEHLSRGTKVFSCE